MHNKKENKKHFWFRFFLSFGFPLPYVFFLFPPPPPPPSLPLLHAVLYVPCALAGGKKGHWEKVGGQRNFYSSFFFKKQMYIDFIIFVIDSKLWNYGIIFCLLLP
ncbi:hypothetical protein DM02DRAFT_181546 [Periconia macrospinosa]|uniref:Uncharacterized protein n=1 Tax=Periconia macrospinosa TaxID=97972 RepID=A0A2V1D9E4_9PLEO|nr:hypothetical protein DM02DRAFT_181546 [Periconia macrospinosa]